jgi:hypothetical protein
VTRLALAYAIAAGVLAPAIANAQQYPYGPPVPPPQQQQPVPPGQAGQPMPGQAPYGTPYTTPYQQPYAQPPYGQPQPSPPPSNDDDAGRKLEFVYATAGAGGAYASLDALSGKGLQLKHLSGAGGAFELGVGLRLLVLTIGPRARALVLSNALLWQLGGEVGLRLPLGHWDPFVSIQGGYTFGSKPSEDVDCPSCGGGSSKSVGLSGGDVGLAGGVDYYLSSTFSLGGDLALMILFLSREAVAGTGVPALDSSASMTGFGAKLGAHAGLHF